VSDVASRPIVGFIGLGRMGLPMCSSLLAARYPLTVFNRTARKADPLRAAGARVAQSVAALAASCDVVVCCLDSLAASESVLLGVDGVVAHARPGTLLIEHGTITPDLAERIARCARVRELEFVDAPVSGGPDGAANRTLAIMVGGSATAYARALPVLESYGSTIRHMGSAGTGTHAKLVNQLLTFTHGAVAAEALAIAERVGLDLAVLGEVLRGGFAQSRMLERTLARVQSGDYEAGAALRLYDKDLGFAAEVGAGANMQRPVMESMRALLHAATHAGLGEHDIAALRLQYPAREQES